MHWDADDWIAVATCAQVAVLGAGAIYAGRQVREARRLRWEQTRPYVVVYAEPHQRVRHLIELVIENIGHTPAHDVTIEFKPPLTSTMGGEARLTDWVALSEGIPYLAPRQRMPHLFESAISLYSEGSELPKRYEVTVTYSDKPSGAGMRKRKRLNGEPHSETHVIDLSVWFGSHYTTDKTVHDAADALEELAKTLKGWTESDGIRTYTSDLQEARAERQARWEEAWESHQEFVKRITADPEAEPDEPQEEAEAEDPEDLPQE